MKWTVEKMTERLIRYEALIPCKNAFVDSRTPGSDQKENFTLIGPGVSENPNQHVHIPQAHGFNIGGARQPPGCLNSQHSHLTAEVFIAHSGEWKMKFGLTGEDGSVDLHPGDTISIPTRMFRGFENVGSTPGFLFAVLGRDNPGKVTWAPAVFELAKKYGLILLKGGKLIDTTLGETVPAGAEHETPPGQDEIARLATPSAERMARCVARGSQQIDPSTSQSKSQSQAHSRSHLDDKFSLAGTGTGLSETAVITPAGETSDGFLFEESPIQPWWEHGFNLRRLDLAPGGASAWHTRYEAEVLFVHQGYLKISWRENESRAGGESGMNDNSVPPSLTMGPGDTLTVPQGLIRRFEAASSADTHKSNDNDTDNDNNNIDNNIKGAQVFVVRGGDHPSRADFFTA